MSGEHRHAKAMTWSRPSRALGVSCRAARSALRGLVAAIVDAVDGEPGDVLLGSPLLAMRNSLARLMAGLSAEQLIGG